MTAPCGPGMNVDSGRRTHPKVLRHKSTQKAVLRYLAFRAGTGRLWGKDSKQESLAKEVGVTRDTVVKALKRFRDEGLIEAMPQHHGPN